jgi:hypothetical protein
MPTRRIIRGKPTSRMRPPPLSHSIHYVLPNAVKAETLIARQNRFFIE